MSKRLTPDVMDIETEDLKFTSVHLKLICKNIEDALIEMDAKPGEDYTYRDLMGWAIKISAHPEISQEWINTWQKYHPDYTS